MSALLSSQQEPSQPSKHDNTAPKDLSLDWGWQWDLIERMTPSEA